MAATFRSLGSPLPAARHAQLHSTGSGPTPETERDLGTLGMLKVSAALLHLPEMLSSCPLPRPIAAGAAWAPRSLPWLHLRPAFGCSSTWWLPWRGEVAGRHPTPGNSEQGARESGWKTELRRSRACTEPATGLPTCVRACAGRTQASAESKAFQELHGGHQAAPEPARKSVAGRRRARRRTAHRAWGGWTPGKGRALVSVPTLETPASEQGSHSFPGVSSS